MRKVSSMLLLAALPALALAGTAQAAGPKSGQSSDYNCWGVVSSQLAQIEGGLGSHVREQSEPRLGLGNVARLFYQQGLISEPTLSALGSFLASIDEYDGTSCPAQ